MRQEENRAELRRTKKRKKWIFSRVGIREKIEIIYGEFSRNPRGCVVLCENSPQTHAGGKGSPTLWEPQLSSPFGTDPPLGRKWLLPPDVLC